MTKKTLHTDLESGFKIPDNYFNEFESDLLLELRLKDQVSKSGFELPEDYLDNLKIDIEKPESKSKVISLFNRKTLLYAASIAAITILVISIPEFNTTHNFATIDDDSMESYMLINDYDAYELGDLIIDSSAFEDAILKETITDASLEDYMYNNAELEDINIE